MWYQKTKNGEPLQKNDCASVSRWDAGPAVATLLVTLLSIVLFSVALATAGTQMADAAVTKGVGTRAADTSPGGANPGGASSGSVNSDDLQATVLEPWLTLQTDAGNFKDPYDTSTNSTNSRFGATSILSLIHI